MERIVMKKLLLLLPLFILNTLSADQGFFSQFISKGLDYAQQYPKQIALVGGITGTAALVAANVNYLFQAEDIEKTYNTAERVYLDTLKHLWRQNQTDLSAKQQKVFEKGRISYPVDEDRTLTVLPGYEYSYGKLFDIHKKSGFFAVMRYVKEARVMLEKTKNDKNNPLRKKSESEIKLLNAACDKFFAYPTKTVITSTALLFGSVLIYAMNK